MPQPGRTGDRPAGPLTEVVRLTPDPAAKTPALQVSLTEPTLGVGFGRGCEGAIVMPLDRTCREIALSIGFPSLGAEARLEVRDGRAELVAALLPARTDTLCWHQEIAGSAHAVMLRGRLSFGNGTPVPFPSALVVWGACRSRSHTPGRVPYRLAYRGRKPLMIGSSGTVMIGHFWPATLRYLFGCSHVQGQKQELIV